MRALHTAGDMVKVPACTQPCVYDMFIRMAVHMRACLHTALCYSSSLRPRSSILTCTTRQNSRMDSRRSTRWCAATDLCKQTHLPSPAPLEISLCPIPPHSGYRSVEENTPCRSSVHLAVHHSAELQDEQQMLHACD
mmetsp:Transcript_7285/g.18420  ORF Transcript_7285/g.18420 Transcript_7285/m.18420 type:complete len:137 (+) Transcript_7285:43-453(+)